MDDLGVTSNFPGASEVAQKLKHLSAMRAAWV